MKWVAGKEKPLQHWAEVAFKILNFVMLTYVGVLSVAHPQCRDLFFLSFELGLF